MPELGWEWWLIIMITINTLFNVLRYFHSSIKKRLKIRNKREDQSKIKSYYLGDEHIRSTVDWIETKGDRRLF
jgi:hypothetical protein